MPIEVRELLIRSQVGDSMRAASARHADGDAACNARQLAQLRQTLLEECKALLATALRLHQER